jgi:hypothetical protein
VRDRVPDVEQAHDQRRTVGVALPAQPDECQRRFGANPIDGHAVSRISSSGIGWRPADLLALFALLRMFRS